MWVKVAKNIALPNIDSSIPPNIRTIHYACMLVWSDEYKSTYHVLTYSLEGWRHKALSAISWQVQTSLFPYSSLFPHFLACTYGSTYSRAPPPPSTIPYYILSAPYIVPPLFRPSGQSYISQIIILPQTPLFPTRPLSSIFLHLHISRMMDSARKQLAFIFVGVLYSWVLGCIGHKPYGRYVDW